MDKQPTDDPEVVRAEVVVEIAGAPGEWHEVAAVRPQRRWKLPLLLFVATCFSTLYVQTPITGDWTGLLLGLRYAVPVMTILVCHEMGHFIQAWRYGVYASLPFFIPMPISPLGTFGAVIAMEPRMGNRKAIFDIGISGPLAGLIPTMIFLVIGLQNSGHGVPSLKNNIYGDPLLFQFLADRIVGPRPAGFDVICDPMAFAGWVGLLITSLNLFPIGQLDGGHILYAILRQKANRVATWLLFATIVVVAWNFRVYGGWLLMLFLLTLMGPTHPPTANDDEPLGLFRTVLGWLTLAFIIIGFTPTPIVHLAP